MYVPDDRTQIMIDIKIGDINGIKQTILCVWT